MPQTSKKHYDYKVGGSAHRPHLIAAERNVEVIAQERGKRNVPAAPEIRKTDRGVGKSKIILEMKSQTQRGTNCACRVTGEIKEDLSGKSHNADPRIERHKRSGITKNVV